MKTAKRERFPRVVEILADAAEGAEVCDWGLRTTMDWVAGQLESVDPEAGKALWDLIDVCSENAQAAIARGERPSIFDGWEGRNNG